MVVMLHGKPSSRDLAQQYRSRQILAKIQEVMIMTTGLSLQLWSLIAAGSISGNRHKGAIVVMFAIKLDLETS
ncbi:MAG: hypothetical protein D6761_06260 [Candidatus Dadabacteria bacterium]|nr:MAG: hypothetical protein D6761_06260 [Candidatus Dadabacteria bacterium]